MLEEALIQMVVEDTEYGQKGIADTIEILREMRCEIGEEALEEWVQRTFVLVQSEEVLLGEVCEPCEDSEDPNERVLVEGDCEESDGEEVVCEVRSNGEDGDTPHRREPNEQLSEQLNLLMQKLPCENAQKAVVMYCLRIACEGEEPLPKTLSAIPQGESLGADDSIGVDIYNTALTGDKVSPLTAGGTTSTGTCPKVMTPVTFEPGIAAREGGHIYEGVSGTLRSNAGDNQMATAYSVENHPADSRVNIDESGKVQTLTSRMGTGGGNVPMVMQQCYSKSKRAQSATDNETWVESEKANTLNAFDVGDVRTTEVVLETIALECNGQRPSHRGDGFAETDKSYTLNTTEVHGVVYALDRASYNQGKNAQYDFEVTDKGVNSPLVAKGPGAVCYGINGDKAGTLDSSYYKGCGMRSTVPCRAIRRIASTGTTVVRTRYIVRRLTPLECERLQGYPDGWTDIGEWTDSNGKRRQTSDAARYKALGNSIALPPWKWILKKICACYERDATMASLFDGIGGFPYLWEQLNGKGTCLWASEIEEFPMAVTKVRIGE